MHRIDPLDPSQAPRASQALFEDIEQELGAVPNLFRTLGHSPAALGAFHRAGEYLARGKLSTELREQIALTVSQQNECAYSLGAHLATGSLHGLSDEHLADARKATSTNSSTKAALQFAKTIVQNRGNLIDSDIDRVRKAGFSERQVIEIAASVMHTMAGNYFNKIAQTVQDFPKAPALQGA